MDPDLALDVITWAYDLNEHLSSGTGPLEVAFHGGEPLLAGIEFFQHVFKGLQTRSLDIKILVQSNLWLLSPDLADLFAHYQVQLGTSLDGPPELTNRWRGHGYYERTVKGIELARSRMLNVSAISTITRSTAPHILEVLNHFADLGLDFKVNPAVPRLNPQLEDASWVLPPNDYAVTVSKLLQAYPAKAHLVRIENLDRDCQAIASGRAVTCTFIDCLGKCLAVDPQGNIFPCMRFVGHGQYCMGRLQNTQGWRELQGSHAWGIIAERSSRVQKECQHCTFWPICHGGCAYNWLAGFDHHSDRDPYCIGYRKLYGEIASSAVRELLAEPNLNALRSGLDISRRSLLQRGPVVDIMTGRTHPDGPLVAYRRIIAAIILALPRPSYRKAEFLVSTGIARTMESAEQSLDNLRVQLAKPYRRANDLYLHVTNACSLQCVHCYASSTPAGVSDTLAPDNISNLALEAAALGYRRIVVTGGEPLEHPQISEVLASLAHIKSELRTAVIGLRTNLMQPIDSDLATSLKAAFDQVVVSIDGDQTSHDARRHLGAYNQVTRNLRKLLSLCPGLVVRIAALVDGSEQSHIQVQSVLDLARQLGIQSVVIRTPKPLGRALRWLDWEHQPSSFPPPDEAIRRNLYPRASCGRGTNLHVEADGRVLACYADLPSSASLGKYPEQNLAVILRSPDFSSVLTATVDARDRCSSCIWRYLCGGTCLAWSHAAGQIGFAADQLCADRRLYATTLLKRALDQLDLSSSLFRTWFGMDLFKEDC